MGSIRLFLHNLFSSLSDKDKDVAVADIIHDASPHPHFFLMVGLSVLMATFGLLLDNASIIIGSMLIAPILSPILSLSLGVVISNHHQIFRSFVTLTKSIFVGLCLSVVATLFFAPQSDIYTAEILARAEPTLMYFSVAVIAGLAVSFARVKPDLSETLPGVAISVALIPPLAVCGIGLSHLDWALASSALVLFVVNAVGIVFASMLMFSLMNLYGNRDVAEITLKKEEKMINRQNNKIRGTS
ncbi:MAG: TIGR00341 family protein [Candidatus Moranbacteria bacterium]|nr:TIGR00341 family protein [Candidatus Moranbacteria bacterium]